MFTGGGGRGEGSSGKHPAPVSVQGGHLRLLVLLRACTADAFQAWWVWGGVWEHYFFFVFNFLIAFVGGDG